MNWRLFGSSNKTEKTNEPLTARFTMCQQNGHKLIKTLFKKDNFISFNTCHDVNYRNGFTKSTKQDIITGPFNENIDFDVIQLNHYKCKTLPEFRYIRSRGTADRTGDTLIYEDVDANFKHFDINEIEDITACNFYKKIV